MKNVFETATYQNLYDQLRNAEDLFRTALKNWGETQDEKALELAKSQSEECARLKNSIKNLLEA